MTSVVFVAATLTLVVKTGMTPGDDPLAVSPIDGLNGPVEVVAADGSKVPCAVRTDGDGRRFVAFRLGKVEMLKRLEYHVRECVVAGDEPDGVPKVLPGMNLIANPGLSRRDKNGDPVGWWPSPGVAQVGKWTDETRANVKSDGDSVDFKNGCWVTFVAGLEEGHVYRVSFERLANAKRAGVIVWYCGKDGRWAPPSSGIGNYKCSKDVPKAEEWAHDEDSSFVYLDKTLKRHIFGNTKLLPGTGSAYIQVYAGEGHIALRNLRYEDVTFDSGVKTELLLPDAHLQHECCGDTPRESLVKRPSYFPVGRIFTNFGR